MEELEKSWTSKELFWTTARHLEIYNAYGTKRHRVGGCHGLDHRACPWTAHELDH